MRGFGVPPLAAALLWAAAVIGEIVEGAGGFGPARTDTPVAPLMSRRVRIGHVFVTSDLVGTTG